jgi:PAS domain-containing protein/HAMP domain-containing protein/HPt (histidine-containing phosphotransfer) domain-containing protein
MIQIKDIVKKIKNVRFNLGMRLFFFIIITASIIFYTTLLFISKNFKGNTNKNIIELNKSHAEKFASTIKSNIEKDFNILKSYVDISEEQSSLSYYEKQYLYDDLLKQMMDDNPYFLSVWDSRELQYIDPSWNKPYGRMTHFYYRIQNNEIKFSIDSADLDGDNFESLYYFYKIVPETAITDPYFYSYTKLDVDKILETSILTPVMYNDKFAGITGIDFSLKYFQQFIDSVNKNSIYKATLFSYNGDIVAHKNKTFIGKNIVVVDTFLTTRFSILDRIHSDSLSFFILKNSAGVDSMFFTLYSFTIDNTHTPWAVLISSSLQDMHTQYQSSYKILLNAMLLGLVILSIIIILFSLNISTPLRKIGKIVDKLAIGDVHNIEKLKIKTHDELGEMSQSINTVIDGLNKVTLFAENIGKGNYDYQFNELSKEDTLGHAIVEMKDSLKKAKKEEKTRAEEAQQLEWASQGMNIFNKILRVDYRDLTQLSYEIIKNLTIYLDAHMGGIYIKTDLNEQEFELISFIGFNKDKYNKKIINTDSGIIGQCILEKQTIFMNDIPEDFDLVTSGLGSSTPRAILIVPLLTNKNLIGLIEIYSLKDIKPYQIKFVERIAETIASTVTAVKTNVRTAELLDKSRKQAEELEQQEEEMRQNMEEMQATQEEASKKESELSAVIEGFNKIMPVIEYDITGKVIGVNDVYLSIHKIQKSQIIGKQHKSDLFMNETEQAKHKEFWDNLADGKPQEITEYVKSGKDDYWFIDKFLPVIDKFGFVHKIICVEFDITKTKKTESQIKQIKSGSGRNEKNKNKNINARSINLNQELEIIDLTYLKMVYKKDPYKIYNILKLYYDTLPAQVVEINEIAKNKDYDKLKQKINSLKTKMSYLGLKIIYEHLRNIEKMLAEDKNLAEIPEVIKNISSFWSSAFEELGKILDIK